jgi:hypothetical protein
LNHKKREEVELRPKREVLPFVFFVIKNIILHLRVKFIPARGERPRRKERKEAAAFASFCGWVWMR